MSGWIDNLVGAYGDTFDVPDTLGTDLLGVQIMDNVPDTYVDVPRSNGITVSGVLKGVETGVNTLVNTWSKVTALNSEVENRKFQQTLASANMDLQKTKALNSIDIAKAQTDANRQIELARAQRGVADQVARTQSSQIGGSNMTGVIILAGLAYALFKGGK